MSGAEPFCKRYYRLQPAEIAWLRFVLESYDGLAFVRSLDGRQALVEIAYPPSRSVDAEALLASLCRESSMSEIDKPDEAANDPL